MKYSTVNNKYSVFTYKLREKKIIYMGLSI